MRNILILITLISGLIFTSLIKNKTRLLDKELLYLDKEINSLTSNLSEANLDFQYLTTPKHISLLAKDFLDEDFSYYKKNQINDSTIREKDLSNLEKSENYNVFNQLGLKQMSSKKLYFVKNTDIEKLSITQGATKEETQDSKNVFDAQNGSKIIKIN